VDRDDARFVVDALESRIAGDRDALERLAASSLLRLNHCAQRIRKAAPDWAPAAIGASVLEDICRSGGGACDAELNPSLQIIVDKMRALADELPRNMGANRAERRFGVAKLPRAARRGLIVPPATRIAH
jgi:hypothetical protein